MTHHPILLVGELCVDFTLATNADPAKMRLGGIAHAARGLWACGVPYAVAAVCPEYLKGEAERFLAAHGCIEFLTIGTTDGAPNVIIIGDVKEVGHQGYEDLLRDARTVNEHIPKNSLSKYNAAVIFPGSYSLPNLLSAINAEAQIVVDIAYDIGNVEALKLLIGRPAALVISTSSELFMSLGARDLDNLIAALRPIAGTLLLKENRGGSRLFDLAQGTSEEIPATLSETQNSVGVGDVFTAVFSSFANEGHEVAAWRGMQVATRYSQTTFPDDFRESVRRDLALPLDVVRSLGGVSLPWHERPEFQIYLAAPDFSYVDRTEIERVVASLKYHNFTVRRPVQENGEVPRGSTPDDLQEFYYKDVALLKECSMAFAIPIQRDPGTLVEMGMAVAFGKPVVTFDPLAENANTMVMCGSSSYSRDLDICLNATFDCISKLRKQKP